MDTREFITLIARYAILLFLAFGNLLIIYFIFTPLTVYSTYAVLELADSTTEVLDSTTIFFKGYYIELVEACVGGSAIYLLLILNLATPMDLTRRWKSLAFVIGTFLYLNVLRILVFVALLVYGYQYFDEAHLATWYFGSTIIVVAIWFVNVWLYKIKKIPVYSDVRDIVHDIWNPDESGEA
jgi:exosortase/archaeosortase family protein